MDLTIAMTLRVDISLLECTLAVTLVSLIVVNVHTLLVRILVLTAWTCTEDESVVTPSSEL